MDVERFGILDYVVFSIMLLISASIGVYFAFFAKQKQNTTAEYLMGGKNMGIFPISMSLIASTISGIAMLGIPSEMYVYGTQYWMSMIGDLIGFAITALIYLPVFFELQLTSTYEYLALRYNKTVRLLGSACFLIGATLYTPIVIYVPALSLAQVTGMSLYVLVPIICLVCIFYTTLGGLKAVVWTDTLQTILMVLAATIVLILGIVDVGGPGTVWQRNLDGDRIEFFNINPDPTIRHTFWNMIFIRMFMQLSASAVNQAIVQRCLAMPTLGKAKMTMLILAVGWIFLFSLCCFTGVVVYAMFYNCDPVLSGKINKYDQLLPYFVMKIASSIPGLPGIFVAGVFSAALSTMSTALNSMTGVLFEDFIKPHMKSEISEARASTYMKVIVIVIGIICTALALAVDKLGGLIQTSASLTSITLGPLLGIFTMGMLCPWVNSIGAITGGIVSTVFVGWISIGTQLAIARQQIVPPAKPVSVDGCPNVNPIESIIESLIPRTTTPLPEINEPFPLYTLSYTWYSMLGVFTCILVGMVVSPFFNRGRPQKIEKKLLSPLIHRFIKDDRNRYSVGREMKNMQEIHEVEQILLNRGLSQQKQHLEEER